MIYDTQCTAFQISLTRYTTRFASKRDSSGLICAVELTYWGPVSSHKIRLQCFLKKLNSNFSKVPAALCPCRSTYLALLSCVLGSRFCLCIFLILATCHSSQPSSTLIAKSWQAAQFLPSSRASLPGTEIALSFFPLSASKNNLYSATYIAVRRHITSEHFL